MTYGTLISTVTVPVGGQAAIDFTSIPGTFTDLVLVMSIRSAFASTADDIGLKFNDLTTSATNKFLQGSGSAATSSGNSYLMNTLESGASSTANTFGNTSVYIPNYAGSTNKSFSVDSVMENNATLSYQRLQAVLWSNTSAITKITIYSLNSANLAQYSTASLYGILKGSGGATVA